MILICYGTRPEIIKISPFIKVLQWRGIPFKTAFSGQHKELYEDVKELVPQPDFYLDVMTQNQGLNDVLVRIASKLRPILLQEKPALIVVQGDTTTAMTAALTGFYESIPVGHIEAGLRTYDLNNPYPEEGNRQIISRVASFNWAPTQTAAKNLEREHCQNIHITGNTIVDICTPFKGQISYDNKVLITLHRRENFGRPLEKMFSEIDTLARQNPAIEFIFPMHPNPNVQKHRPLLEHVNVIDPIGYFQMIKLLQCVKFVISDSGGIQEECATFGKKILVCRKTTERPEGVESGFAKLIGDKVIQNFHWANDNPAWQGVNPFGDGKACERIVDSIVDCGIFDPKATGHADPV